MKGQIMHIRMDFDVIYVVHILELVVVNKTYLGVGWQFRAAQEILSGFLVRASAHFHDFPVHFEGFDNMIKQQVVYLLMNIGSDHIRPVNRALVICVDHDHGTLARLFFFLQEAEHFHDVGAEIFWTEIKHMVKQSSPRLVVCAHVPRHNVVKNSYFLKITQCFI